MTVSAPTPEGKWDEVLALARSEDLEIVVSNTTEAGIAYTQGDSAVRPGASQQLPRKADPRAVRALQGIQRRC